MDDLEQDMLAEPKVRLARVATRDKLARSVTKPRQTRTHRSASCARPTRCITRFPNLDSLQTPLYVLDEAQTIRDAMMPERKDLRRKHLSRPFHGTAGCHQAPNN